MMELDQLTREDLLIINRMLMGGKAFSDIEIEFVPQVKRDLVESLHTLTCEKEHLSEEGCHFYKEKDYTEKDKREWLLYVENLLHVYKATLQELNLALLKSAMVISSWETAIHKEPETIRMLIAHILLRVLPNPIPPQHPSDSQSPEH